MRGRAASEVLALPVRVHGIELGQPVDALLDPHAGRVVGFEVRCGDGVRRFLPFAVARLREDQIEIDSPLMLIDERGLDFYRRHSRSLGAFGYEQPVIAADGGVHEALSAA